MTTRRDFVAMLLGAPIAAALGCGSRAPRIPEGELVDTGQRRGHAVLRDGALPSVTTWRQHRVAIVGSGVAGLAAAWELRRRGIEDVIVLELDEIIGGTARGGSSAVTSYPWGAHYIVAPSREQVELTALLGELGAIESVTADGTPVIDEALRCREPEERVFYRGRWYEGLYLHAGESHDDIRQLATFLREIDTWASWRDASGRPAFAIPVSRSSDAPELAALDRMSFAAWLDAKRLTSERLRWLCEYACRDDYGLSATDTSAWAGLFYFASRARGPGGHSQPVLTWPDGNYTLVRHFAAKARIETGVAVHRVERDGSLVATGRDGVFGVRAERVIVAAPAFVANRLVSRDVPAGDYGAWAVANVHLRARPIERRDEPPAWDNVIRDSASLGYVSATHQRGRDRGPTVWTWYYPFVTGAKQARTQLAGAGYAEWAEVVLTDLERAHRGIRGLVDRIEVAFWGHGMIRPRVGSVFAPERAARARPIDRIHFAHTDLSGIALFEEAFDHGLRAAREVAEALA
jgi:phytoene dehydrogenase-like protein